MRTEIAKMIGTLAAVMFVIFAVWEALERLIWAIDPPTDMGTFYLIRGVSTGIVMAALAAWLMARFRRSFEARIRRQSEEAHRMRLFFENIVQDAGEAILSLDTEGIIRSWNRSAEAIYGYRADEIVGRNLSRLVPPDLQAAGEIDKLDALVAREGYVRNWETRRVHKDGTVLIVRITRSALRDAAGRVVGTTAIVSDITAEKEMETRLMQVEKLAAVGQAAAGIAHEVRNALGGISGAIQVLKRSPAWRGLPDGFGDEVELQIGRIAHIVHDLLTFARPGSLRPQPADLHRILDHVLDATAAGVEGADKRISRQYAAGDALAEVDPAWMEQAFTNVVTNACQAMEPGGSLKVATRRDNGKIQVEFTDDGCGMAGETLEHAFDPFFTTKARGTGLGLPIVRTIVEAHRGAVDLESSPEEGTSLIVTLPSAATGA